MKSNPFAKSMSVVLLAAVMVGGQEARAQDNVTEEDKPFLLNYPNLKDSDGRVVLTNEHVVLQRLVVPAGKWEGVHSHPGNQVYLQIKGGTWSQREGGGQAGPAESMQPGAVGWVDAVDIGAAHEEGNTGDTTMDFVLVTIK